MVTKPDGMSIRDSFVDSVMPDCYTLEAMSRPILFQLAVAFLGLFFLGSQTAVLAQQESIIETRTIPLAVYDSKGLFMTGLKPEQIRTKGMPAIVRRVSLEQGPRRIVLLLDTSGSMSFPNGVPRQNAIRLAKQILADLPPEDSVALYTYADEPHLLNSFTTDRELLTRQIDSIPDWGRGLTRFTSALATILTSHSADLKFGDDILCLSDGYEMPDFGRNRDALIANFQKMSVRFYFVRVVSEIEAQEGIAEFWSFARTTGGTSIVPELADFIPHEDRPNPNYLVSALEPKKIKQMSLWIRDLIQAVYSIQLEFPKPLTKPSNLNLEVVDSNGVKLKGTALYYPQRLMPFRSDHQ